MKSFVAMLVGLIFVVGTMTGCASRTMLVAGPVQVAGQVQAFDSFQTPSFDFGLKRIGFVLGHVGVSVESSFGPCPEVIGISSSTGKTEKVLNDVPSLNPDLD